MNDRKNGKEGKTRKVESGAMRGSQVGMCQIKLKSKTSGDTYTNTLRLCCGSIKHTNTHVNIKQNNNNNSSNIIIFYTKTIQRNSIDIGILKCPYNKKKLVNKNN